LTQQEFDLIKQDVLALLQAHGFERVIVGYNGMCDEGQFYIAEYVPQSHYDKFLQIIPSGLADLRAFAGIGQDDYLLREVVADLACAGLAVRRRGWEINGGSQGEFTIDVAAGKVRLAHCVREIHYVDDDDEEI
jgi:hypothetical protein